MQSLPLPRAAVTVPAALALAALGTVAGLWFLGRRQEAEDHDRTRARLAPRQGEG